MVCALEIASVSSSSAATLSLMSRSLAAPTAPSVMSLATWISSQRAVVPGWSAMAESMKTPMASV